MLKAEAATRRHTGGSVVEASVVRPRSEADINGGVSDYGGIAGYITVVTKLWLLQGEWWCLLVVYGGLLLAMTEQGTMVREGENGKA